MRIDTAPELGRTRSHWYWRPGWAPGRRMCTFHLTMERADAVRGLARSVRPVLERFELVDSVPEPWLHLTMNGLGFAGEVPDDRLEAVADEVFALWSSLDDPVLRFTHLFVGLEGAMLVAERSDWLMALARAQRAAIDRLLGPREWGDFWPHASLCYFNGPMDPRPLVGALAPVLDAVPDGVDAAPALTLMRLGRDERVYTWEALRRA
ncbi:2'-5' RNA ligase family protein [Actinomyces dentalis]|uniref:2'-5' RNA ligase family protein n=1 Tax=Actinomyces dentalis TaxID=272548 RepID=UPI0003F92193|nr:hypothetical protein [Actinomyces dentalis]